MTWIDGHWAVTGMGSRSSPANRNVRPAWLPRCLSAWSGGRAGIQLSEQLAGSPLPAMT
jgi:hypothetical protein